MQLIRYLIYILVFSICSDVRADAILTIKNSTQTIQLHATELLKRSELKTVEIKADPAYKKSMRYQAIPLAKLLSEHHFAATDTLNFVALDGFAANLPANLILQPNSKSEAWLAIETEQSPWPALSNTSKASAGPFYLIWLNPAENHITQEEWPYQIARIEHVLSVESRFPMLLPDKSIAENDPVRKGFLTFQKNCLACHKLNGGGESSVGPDLNIPQNPTQYFQINYLKQLIRNPKQVRTWPDAKMPSFDEKTISDEALDNLIEYLKHKASIFSQ